MANPPKKKGTAGETELLRLLQDFTGRSFRRTTPGTKWDLETDETLCTACDPIRILAIRPDRGSWLFVLTPEDWFADPMHPAIRVEVKRYARSFIHKLYKEKFGA